MANSLTNVAEIMVSLGVATLRENAIMARIVNRDRGNEARERNESIRVPIPSAVPASAVTPGVTQPAGTDLSPTAVTITLDQWYEARFTLTDRELQEVETSRILPMAVDEGIKSLANNIDAFIIDKVYKRAYSTIDATAPVAVKDITGLRRLHNVELSPVNDRRLVVDPTIEDEMLQLSEFRDLDKTGERDPLLEGTLGRRFGFDIFMDQNMVSHTAGTGAGTYQTSATAALGAKTISVDTGTGTVLEGDILTFDADTSGQQYVVTSSVGGDPVTSISFEPGLKRAALDNDAITIKATHAIGALGIQRNAFMFAMRPLSIPVGTPGAVMASATDPISGLTLRSELVRTYKQSMWSLDVLYGGEVVRPQLLSRLAN